MGTNERLKYIPYPHDHSATTLIYTKGLDRRSTREIAESALKSAKACLISVVFDSSTLTRSANPTTNNVLTERGKQRVLNEIANSEHNPFFIMIKERSQDTLPEEDKPTLPYNLDQ